MAKLHQHINSYQGKRDAYNNSLSLRVGGGDEDETRSILHFDNFCNVV